MALHSLPHVTVGIMFPRRLPAEYEEVYWIDPTIWVSLEIGYSPTQAHIVLGPSV